MLAAVAHRGPDGQGVWIDERAGVALGHRRLAILDLSPAGAQPMTSGDDRFVISFNGEIYNYEELRRELMAIRPQVWRGHSDTEVLLEAISTWGLAAALPRLNGMFAISCWDTRERRLFLARDRVGEKPLFYGWHGNALLFGSELKAIRAFIGTPPPIDRLALARFVQYSYVPAPLSIYEGFRKLHPASWIAFDMKTPAGSIPKEQVYWDLSSLVASAGTSAKGTAGSTAVESVLADAIAKQMVADVPVGAFLSGGIDSTAVVALMQKQSSRPVKTFTIGFDVREFDEAPHANAVAKFLGTDHTSLYVTEADVLELMPLLPDIYDEPLADSSQVPTYLVSKLARNSVKVSLSGDGGDELFCGYNHYFDLGLVSRYSDKIPRRLQLPAHKLLTSLDHVLRPLGSRTARRFMKAAYALSARSRTDRYSMLSMHWLDEPDVILGVSVHDSLHALPPWLEELSDLQLMSAADVGCYLPDSILAKVDRAAMSFGLETRIPLLDYRLVELAFEMAVTKKIIHGVRKMPLRQIAYRHVPRDIVDRPKQGFAIPLGQWLRTNLRDWAESLLNERVLREQGFLDPELVRRRWKEHLRGLQDWHRSLWNVLVFQAWFAATHEHGMPQRHDLPLLTSARPEPSSLSKL
jgi:asparagine synthase (glutamine-hydrolysing)